LLKCSAVMLCTVVGKKTALISCIIFDNYIISSNLSFLIDEMCDIYHKVLRFWENTYKVSFYSRHSVNESLLVLVVVIMVAFVMYSVIWSCMMNMFKNSIHSMNRMQYCSSQDSHCNRWMCPVCWLVDWLAVLICPHIVWYKRETPF